MSVLTETLFGTLVAPKSEIPILQFDNIHLDSEEINAV